MKNLRQGHFIQPPSDSGTRGAVQTTSKSREPNVWIRYWKRWTLVPRELCFLLLTMPIAIIGFSVLFVLIGAGVGTIIIVFFGLILLIAAIYAARGFGTIELIRLRWAGNRPIVEPQWRTPGVEGTFWRAMSSAGTRRKALFGPFTNGHYWLYLLHGLVINPIVSMVTWTITVIWLAVGTGGATSFYWRPCELVAAPAKGSSTGLCHSDGVNGPLVIEIGGLLFLATLPFVARGLTIIHDSIARRMLGVWRSEGLKREVANLSASREAAVMAEDHSLRRLERDIHDGLQQSLIRLQMDLASAGRLVDADPDHARYFIDGARSQANEALDELRALSRGFAPPIVEDRGLRAGFDSLVARSPLPVLTEITLSSDVRLPHEIERNAYFVVSELLTNIAKHSGATTARLTAALREESGLNQRWLDIRVSDEGKGGAQFIGEHGLCGLEERLSGLRGTLEVHSPVGGPTVVEAHIPVEGDATSGSGTVS